MDEERQIIMSAQPHGGKLVNRVLAGEEAIHWRQAAPELPRITLSQRELLDLDLLALGAFSPLTGFMRRDDYCSVVETMHLANGTIWTLPVTLPVATETAANLREGDAVALMDADTHLRGILLLQERYPYDKQHEAREVYRTDDQTHPGVRALMEQGDVLLGGDIWLLDPPSLAAFGPHTLSPVQTRTAFAAHNWQTIVGFQTRNPVHRAHEYIQKCALEVVDGLLLHPLVGETKEDDVPAAVRMRCYEVLLRDYYPANRVLLGTFPARMRYAGPREAVFHAMVRKNYGCTHFIVGRDHAGVGNFYGTYDAQTIFSNFTSDELGLTPLFFEHTFYCYRCAGMASSKTCPHTDEARVILSGTRVRAMLRSGQTPPPEFSRPEVAEVLVGALQETAIA
jgi:sulfate adenylyltransferase